MTQWPFVIGAYAVAIVLTGGLLGWSYVTMRRAEAAAEELTRK